MIEGGVQPNRKNIESSRFLLEPQISSNLTYLVLQLFVCFGACAYALFWLQAQKTVGCG